MTYTRRRRTSFRLLVAWLTLAVGLWALVGCIYVPHLGKARVWDGSGRAGDPAPEAFIGTAKQGRDLTLGKSTADDVTRVLSSPIVGRNALSWSPDRRYAVCSYRVVSGYLVFPLCFFESEPMPDDRYLRLTFDENHLLRDYKVFDNYADAADGTTLPPPDRRQ